MVSSPFAAGGFVTGWRLPKRKAAARARPFNQGFQSFGGMGGHCPDRAQPHEKQWPPLSKLGFPPALRQSRWGESKGGRPMISPPKAGPLGQRGPLAAVLTFNKPPRAAARALAQVCPLAWPCSPLQATPPNLFHFENELRKNILENSSGFRGALKGHKTARTK